ncbi:alpha/beta hydrolase family protein [Flavicella marina]|uniref:alpha/beta hydrolase family protein n=1 Tax=Flavicella marina TaxID=1475951 RepID=UPI00126453BA|nr:prolyl oligopeptidase family serine peptidase [Flavicella marina]
MKIKNIVLDRANDKPILADVCYRKNAEKKPLVIFCHGYKGYKDWGAFDLMSDVFIDNNLFLLKFNFSHNGGTMENPIDFPDLEAFGQNNYSKEQNDLKFVIDWVLQQEKYANELDSENIILIGHSRGGGAVILKASQDDRIKKLITWAAVSDYKSRFPVGPILEHWKKEGVAYIENSRTLQQMPHYIQFYEDFIANEDRLTIKTAATKLKISHLIVHGSEDTTVGIEEAKNIEKWSSKSELLVVPEGDHGFGAKQPWEEEKLPKDFAFVLEKSLAFINDK